MSKVRVKAGTFNAKQKENAPFILRELQRYLIHIFARCFKQVLWRVVGGREGWGTRRNKCRRKGKVLYIFILSLPLVTSRSKIP